MTDNMKNKWCPHCQNHYPATTENFQVDRSRFDGLFAYCKSCASVKRRERYRKNPEKWRERQREYIVRKILEET